MARRIFIAECKLQYLEGLLRIMCLHGKITKRKINWTAQSGSILFELNISRYFFIDVGPGCLTAAFVTGKDRKWHITWTPGSPHWADGGINWSYWPILFARGMSGIQRNCVKPMLCDPRKKPWLEVMHGNKTQIGTTPELLKLAGSGWSREELLKRTEKRNN